MSESGEATIDEMGDALREQGYLLLTNQEAGEDAYWVIDIADARAGSSVTYIGPSMDRSELASYLEELSGE